MKRNPALSPDNLKLRGPSIPHTKFLPTSENSPAGQACHGTPSWRPPTFPPQSGSADVFRKFDFSKLMSVLVCCTACQRRQFTASVRQTHFWNVRVFLELLSSAGPCGWWLREVCRGREKLGGAVLPYRGMKFCRFFPRAVCLTWRRSQCWWKKRWEQGEVMRYERKKWKAGDITSKNRE